MPRKRTITHDNHITQAEKLLALLADGHWHSTRELVHRVGHTFAVAKFKLVHRYHHDIERERHPSRSRQHRYRLIRPPNG